MTLTRPHMLQQQLSLFEHASKLPQPIKKLWHKSERRVSTPAYTIYLISSPFSFMSSSIASKPLRTASLFDKESETLPPASTNLEESNALPVDRSSTHSGSAWLPPKAYVQQVITFNDEPDGSHASTQPSESNGTPEAGRLQEIQTATIERGHGDSSQRTSGNDSNPSPVLSNPTSVVRNKATQATRSPSSRLTAKRNNSYRPLFDLVDDLDSPYVPPTLPPATKAASSTTPAPARSQDTLHPQSSGDKSKARDILHAIRVLKRLSHEQRAANDDECQALRKFGGFGPVALGLFPDPLTGQYKDHGWQVLGKELESLLSSEEYDSAKRTTFNAFYTSPIVIQSMHKALDRLGVGPHSTILEPGCGIGNFLSHDRTQSRYIGIEMDRLSGQIASHLYPQHDIRIEDFRETKLPANGIDAVIGNVPFANIKLDYNGNRLSLHDYFFAKSVDALKPGGILALVTSHFTLDKQNASVREYLASKADFLGAIRLPADAFKQEGTKVVTDIIFLKRRPIDAPAQHVDTDWINTSTIDVENSPVQINSYFAKHPEMVLGTFTLANQLYGGEGYSVTGSGSLADDLNEAIARLPSFATKEVIEKHAEVTPARFNRPPPQKHITEGSFFVGDDHHIYQIKGGESCPVTHGSMVLSAKGTMMGQRLAALIGLRDAARLVLQSQNEDWPEAERNQTRLELNTLYDRFVKQYGPINKTSFSESADGNVTRRMPNLVKFRDDPDAMLVMALEDYDEVTGLAAKASIFSTDVVHRTHDVTHVKSAEEGLLVSLDRRGTVELSFIESLYGKPSQTILSELGDLVYLNPESRQWETADVYLSGNVREKLITAQAAGPEFARNAQKLMLVQPPDVLPGDIDAKLGSPWIPVADIEAFASELFGVPAGSIAIRHLKKDAVFSVDADYRAENSVAATSDYGTSRTNGLQLFEQALNMKSPQVYDTVKGVHGDERVLNQDATLAAKEKQKLIKEKFKSWIFNDAERSERLVRLYNDTYNNLRLREFDGSHLEFPGMNQTISLRPHQKNAIWRAMSGGNTLFAHTVGAGKTFTMAAAGMKLKQAGLVKKPMFVVPNHMLEQFSREFLQLYPNAHLLIASKEDMTRDNRKYLTAKIASNDWDGIVVTHSSFERIGMSREYQQAFLKEQIREYEDLLIDAASNKSSGKHRNLIKTIEKQKAARENLLKELSAEAKKDDGLVFDELGVDHVFVDEAHYFKNLETPTKMDRVAGVQTGGSQRAFDLYMKARYLDGLHKDHGVTFATGTPISNSMVEMYSMQRFLDLNGLVERGIDHFDAWAANFGEVVDSMEISPDGSSLRSRSRFAKFNNLPELQQMFRSFADVQTSEMLNLPRPSLKGGKPETISSPMSMTQIDLQGELIKRYDRIRSQRIDPREDNALAITTDGRKLALDARLVSPMASDYPDSKINKLVQNVYQNWVDHAATKGTQLIFCDIGVQPNEWGFSVYDDIVRKLLAMNIPGDQIAVMGDADSDAKKQALFERVRNGVVRILLGSTTKMGTGTNVQKRLTAIHHVDAPWKPAEVEQRDGRILRQGNMNNEVSIYRYVTEGSFDAYMWQALETKARFISQIMTGSSGTRQADDIGGQELSYAEVKAIASGNPAVLTLAEADAELQRLNILRKSHADEQFLARRKLQELPKSISEAEKRYQGLLQDRDQIERYDAWELTLKGRQVKHEDAVKSLGEQLERLTFNPPSFQTVSLGEYHGLTFGLDLSPFGPPEVFIEGNIRRSVTLSRDSHGARAVLNALQRLKDTYSQRMAETEQQLKMSRQQLHDFRQRQGSVFAHEDHFQQMKALRDQLKLALSDIAPKDEHAPVLDAHELSTSIQEILSSKIEASSPNRPSDQLQHTTEVPITLQIKNRLHQLPPEEADIQEHDSQESTRFRNQVRERQSSYALTVA